MSTLKPSFCAPKWLVKFFGINYMANPLSALTVILLAVLLATGVVSGSSKLILAINPQIDGSWLAIVMLLGLIIALAFVIGLRWWINQSVDLTSTKIVYLVVSAGQREDGQYVLTLKSGDTTRTEILSSDYVLVHHVDVDANKKSTATLSKNDYYWKTDNERWSVDLYVPEKVKKLDIK